MTQHASSALVWFRQDLRLADNPALAAAIASGRRVLPFYLLDDESPGAWRLGGASRWWLHHSLLALAASLEARGATLLLRRGPAATAIPALVAETSAAELHAGRMHEPWAREVEAKLQPALGGRLHLHRTATLFELDAIRTGSGGAYAVYTPFARACRTRLAVADPLPAPERIHGAPPPRSDRLEDWGLLPGHPDWAAGLRATWEVGEAAAVSRLHSFLAEAVFGYKSARNQLGQPGTSMLSAHLHWGELSPRQVWHATRSVAPGEGLDAYLGEILWREFAAYLLWHNPALPERPLRPAFDSLPYRDAPAELGAWQRGRTGFPIVDAGMRQLWRIGWMHNRVRMIAASFLVKQLLIDWREGERWFWDTLVDADLASNAASWQWVAGSGIDSQPFVRVFNPVTQGETWDQAGEYVRRWVPELARVPDRWVHAPWTAPAAVLEHAGLVLGRDYPRPIVDLAETRRRALAAYRSTVRAEAA
ncbi:MAG TPA: deoxyribodipyrimidine photo-lyase [Acetobacteraceae bacterium]|nr:deoxyribodipyrimidine photo-lyase [Acetobacteraceae bacterium]